MEIFLFFQVINVLDLYRFCNVISSTACSHPAWHRGPVTRRRCSSAVPHVAGRHRPMTSRLRRAASTMSTTARRLSRRRRAPMTRRVPATRRVPVTRHAPAMTLRAPVTPSPWVTPCRRRPASRRRARRGGRGRRTRERPSRGASARPAGGRPGTASPRTRSPSPAQVSGVRNTRRCQL